MSELLYAAGSTVEVSFVKDFWIQVEVIDDVYVGEPHVKVNFGSLGRMNIPTYDIRPISPLVMLAEVAGDGTTEQTDERRYCPGNSPAL